MAQVDAAAQAGPCGRRILINIGPRGQVDARGNAILKRCVDSGAIRRAVAVDVAIAEGHTRPVQPHTAAVLGGGVVVNLDVVADDVSIQANPQPTAPLPLIAINVDIGKAQQSGAITPRKTDAAAFEPCVAIGDV